ncbi:MAG: MFS transporter [Pseudomonadota bacterium]
MSLERTNWTGVAFGLTVAIFAAFQMFKLPPLMPVLLERYGYDRTLAGGFMSVYALSGLAFSLYIGRLVERLGPLKPVLGGLLLMLIGNLLALAHPESGWLVLAARALEGLGFAGLAIAGPTLVNHSASQRHLPLLVGFTAIWIPVGQVTASLAAPLALELGSWQLLWIFAILLTLVFVALTLWLQAGQRLGQTAAPKATQSAVPKRRPGETLALWLAAGVFLLWSGQYFAFMTWLPQYLVEAHELDLSHALAGYLLPVVVLIVFALIAGWLLRLGVPLSGLLMGALAIQAAVWFWQPGPEQPGLGLVALIAYGVGSGITPTCLFAMPSAIAGRQRTARAFGVIMTGRNVGVFIGPILLAQAFELTGSWSTAGPLFGVCTLLCLLTAGALAVQLRAMASKEAAEA